MVIQEEGGGGGLSEAHIYIGKSWNIARAHFH